MNSAAFSFLFVIATAFASATVAFAVDPNEAKSKMLKVWDDIKHDVHSMRLDETEENWRISGSDQLSLNMRFKSHCEFSQSGFLFQNDAENFDKDGAITRHIETIDLSNVSYKAKLKKNPKSSDWLLAEQSPADSDETRLNDRQQSSCPWALCGNINIIEWIADDCFVISQVEELANSETWRIHFHHDEALRKNLPKETLIAVKSGYIDVDRAHKFVPTAFRYDLKGKAREEEYTGVKTGKLTYDSSGSLPVIKEITEETELQSPMHGIRKSKSVFAYDNFEYNGKVSDEVFRLSHYGLPEPPNVVWSRPTPTFVWLLAGAGVCVFFAAGFRRVARRSR
jgi:hypothetical protein